MGWKVNDLLGAMELLSLRPIGLKSCIIRCALTFSLEHPVPVGKIVWLYDYMELSMTYHFLRLSFKVHVFSGCSVCFCLCMVPHEIMWSNQTKYSTQKQAGKSSLGCCVRGVTESNVSPYKHLCISWLHDWSPQPSSHCPRWSIQDTTEDDVQWDWNSFEGLGTGLSGQAVK